MRKAYNNLPFEIVVDVEDKSGSISSQLKKHVSGRAADVLESLILAHACAGVAIGDTRYMEGIKTAVEAIQNNT